MVAASDIAAMGARSLCALVSVTAPAHCDLDGFGRGVAEASTSLDCPVIGGDLSGGPVLAASVTVLGTLPADGRPALRRSGARPGDALLVTGSLGSSAAGLRLLRAGTDAPARLVAAYLRPVAPMAQGLAARRGGATAAIDVSDGLAGDLRHLSAASGVGVTLDHVPVADGATLEEALGGGEDYALLVAASDPDRLGAAFAEADLPEPVCIGRCTDRPGHLLLHGARLGEAGWRHQF
ncbi:MAG TPA: thiamine-phosphate kinase, partial [Acidimicrobiales bacterium]|nr:thiamine-phosphate kinase [Acidimicrobiales bacterium]